MRAAWDLCDLDNRVAESIISAQMASDASKNIDEAARFWGDVRWSKKPLKGGYSLKPFYIMNAIRMIMNGKSHFRFSVRKTPDQNGIDGYAVAFSYKPEDRDDQVVISFHLPERDAFGISGLVKNAWELPFAPEKGTSRGNARRLAQDMGWVKPKNAVAA